MENGLFRIILFKIRSNAKGALFKEAAKPWFLQIADRRRNGQLRSRVSRTLGIVTAQKAAHKRVAFFCLKDVLRLYFGKFKRPKNKLELGSIVLIVFLHLWKPFFWVAWGGWTDFYDFVQAGFWLRFINEKGTARRLANTFTSWSHSCESLQYKKRRVTIVMITRVHNLV